MRARLALQFCNVEVEIREISLRNKPKEMLEVSPKGTVPVLIADGKVIDESLDIMYFAYEQAKKQVDLLGYDSLIQENDTYFKKYLDAYKYPGRHDISDAREKACVYLDKLEEIMPTTSEFLNFATFPFVRQFAKVDLDWFLQSKYENLIKWFHDMQESEIFNIIMKKRKVYE